jgi:hypothetical protein
MGGHRLAKGFQGGGLNVEGAHYKVDCKLAMFHCTLALVGVAVL